jgi:hypothetical protein
MTGVRLLFPYDFRPRPPTSSWAASGCRASHETLKYRFNLLLESVCPKHTTLIQVTPNFIEQFRIHVHCEQFPVGQRTARPIGTERRVFPLLRHTEIQPALGVARITGPAVLHGIFYYGCAHRIELDVAITTQHKLGNTLRLTWSHQKMHRVGHQHIGVNITGLVLGRVGGAFEIELIALVRKERRLPVIAPMNDMLGPHQPIRSRFGGACGIRLAEPMPGIILEIAV